MKPEAIYYRTLQEIKHYKTVSSQPFDIIRTKSHNLNASRLVLQLPLPNPLKPCVESRMKM